MSDKANRPSIARARRQFLVKLAEEIADDFCAELPQVDPSLILQENDISISFGDYGQYFDGMLHFEEGMFHVYCNEVRCGSRHDGRARFTLGHELGHYFIPEHNAALRSGVAPHHPSFCNRPNAELYVESEADLFASRLLMPEARFRKVAVRNGHGLAAMQKTANALGTSLQSTALRFGDSDTHPCAFVFWRDGKDPWFGVSTVLQKYGLRYVKTSTEGLAVGSATAKALAESGPATAKIHETVSLMSVWFPAVFNGSARDLPVREEAIRTSYGTLTWLSVKPDALEKVEVTSN
jgi:hypothetical protein